MSAGRQAMVSLPAGTIFFMVPDNHLIDLHDEP